MSWSRWRGLAIAVVVGIAAACATSSNSSNCSSTDTSCGGACVNLGQDPSNCGACGKKCATNEVCSKGTCGASCSAGLTACSGACADLQKDAKNCGSCGKVCAGNGTCSQGKCSGGDGGGACDAGTVSCGGTCTDVKTDAKNCGQCGTVCDPGLSCVASQCTCTGGLTACPKVVSSGDAGTDGGPTDASSDAAVTLACVDTKTDLQNCGGCGVVCKGGSTCKLGDGGTPVCYSPCGDGVVGGSEACDDGNQIDNDGCTNSCTLGTITVAGNQRAWVKNALTALGETFTEYTANQWAPAGGGGILIESNDGGNPVADYATNVNGGTHVLIIGGSGTGGWGNFVNPFLTTDNTITWHTLSCSPHWTKGVAHPITQFLPATYTFATANVSYHMHHLNNVQPAGVTILGSTCEATQTQGVAAVRLANSKGTFTDLAFDTTGSFADSAAETAFMKPFIQGYLAYVRGPH